MPQSFIDALVKSRLMVTSIVGWAIARQLWWAIAHPTSYMLNFRLFTTPSLLNVRRWTFKSPVSEDTPIHLN